MKTINHTGLAPFISPARLRTYSNFFAPTDQVELLGCYLWSKEVAAAFFPLLQVLEVTLRNAVHNEAKAAIGPYWFDNVATRTRSASESRQAAAAANSITDARATIRRERSLSATAAISEDRIIAKLTFGYWTTIFGSAFDVNRNPRALWPRLLRPVFPNAPQGHRSRNLMHAKLLGVKTFRNKAFHHEPIWNIGRPVSVLDAIAKLQETCDDVLDVIGWVSLDCLDLVEKAGYVSTVRRVCSFEHLEYLKYPNINEKSISIVKRELRGIMRKKNNTTDILINNSRSGRLHGG